MPTTTRRTRLFRLFRRGTAFAGGGARSVEEENALWLAHERAATGVREATEAAQRIASNLAKERSVVDGAADRTRSVSVRTHELAAAVRKIGDAFERLGLVALNAGLEGARVGETAGRALSLVADEVREHAQRGGEAGRAVELELGELGRELAALSGSLDRVKEGQNEANEQAALAAAAASTSGRALSEIGERIREAMGTDAETARAIADATEHARALVGALRTISGRAPRALVLGALRPILEPLANALSDDGATNGSGDDGGSA